MTPNLSAFHAWRRGWQHPCLLVLVPTLLIGGTAEIRASHIEARDWTLDGGGGSAQNTSAVLAVSSFGEPLASMSLSTKGAMVTHCGACRLLECDETPTSVRIDSVPGRRFGESNHPSHSVQLKCVWPLQDDQEDRP